MFRSLAPFFPDDILKPVFLGKSVAFWLGISVTALINERLEKYIGVHRAHIDGERDSVIGSVLGAFVGALISAIVLEVHEEYWVGGKKFGR